MADKGINIKDRYCSYELELLKDRKEIERLNQELRGLNNCIIEFHSEFCNKQAEINRLNNIINEFDKWLDEESEKTILSTGHLTCLMMCKNKLQELKGSDKE